MKLDRFEIVDRCLYWKEENALIVGDLHLGYEESLNEGGILFPKSGLAESLELFEKIFHRVGRKLKKIVLLGDVKHYFSRVLISEFRDFYKLMDLFRSNLLKNGDVVVCKGNHDSILEPVLKDYDFVELADFYFLSGVLFLHGDRFSFKSVGLRVFEKDVGFIIMGHFHPAFGVEENNGGIKKEVYKCFLYGKSKELKKKVVVVPSFFPLVEGKSVLDWNLGNLGERFSVKNFEVYVLSGEFNNVLKFGGLKRFL